MKRIIVLCLLAVSLSAYAEDPEAKATLAEIKSTFGFVPTFMAVFPEEGLPGAWDEFKNVQMNPKTAIPQKYKELIGLGVSAQIPCEYCVYFHTKAAKANGATEKEIREAVGMAAVVRHWSTWLNGAQIDESSFKKDLDLLIANAKSGAKPPEPMAVTDAKSAREDIKRSMGFVPGFMAAFPESGVAGAWKEMKGLQMNPNTAIPLKYKELIGLAVASQIPCHYCTTFHTAAATQLDGATPAETQEAVAMAALVRHWSTVLNGNQIDRNAFRAEVDRAMAPKAPGKQTARAP